MKKNYIIASIVVVVLITILLSKLINLDVVATASISSFKVITEKLEARITSDRENYAWSLSAPDDSARFIWSQDFSLGTKNDIMMEFASKPFIEAGLDISKLPKEMVTDGAFTVGTTLGNQQFNYEATPLSSYEKIVEFKRENIKYHTELDHYGVDLENGNMFEWAADINTNDKDIVFVLNPEPFIKAGADIENIDGWLYAKIPTMIDGKKTEVYKLLKPFNIN